MGIIGGLVHRRPAPTAHPKDPASPVDGHSPGDSHVQHHGHGHGHGPLLPTSIAVRRLLVAVTVPLVIANVIALAALWPRSTPDSSALSSPASVPALIAATVTGLDVGSCASALDVDAGALECVDYEVRLRGGVHDGIVTTLQQTLTAAVRLRVHDRIYVMELGQEQGTVTYGFYEFQRERPLLLLLVGFVVAALVIGRRAGFRALVALALSLGLLVKFMLPAILAGRNPLLVALVGGSAVMFLALYLTHGVNVRTTSAVLGTTASLVITGVLATLAVDAARFTGLSGEGSGYLRATAGQIDLRGLLLAGVLIGALGVLDDVTVTQAAAVWELHQANPELGFRGRFDAAIRIGRDHIASVVNTLVLAYAGAALPLLLLFTQAGTPLGEVFNGEPVATEIVRMLAGSIGLMCAVPITTALTSFVVGFDHPTNGTPPISRIPRVKMPRKAAKPWSPPRAEQKFRDGSP